MSTYQLRLALLERMRANKDVAWVRVAVDEAPRERHRTVEGNSKVHYISRFQAPLLQLSFVCQAEVSDFPTSSSPASVDPFHHQNAVALWVPFSLSVHLWHINVVPKLRRVRDVSGALSCVVRFVLEGGFKAHLRCDVVGTAVSNAPLARHTQSTLLVSTVQQQRKTTYWEGRKPCLQAS